MANRIYREHVTSTKQMEQLELYGVKVTHWTEGWTASHITGGFIGPYENRLQLIEEAYDLWINNPDQSKPLR